MEFIELEVVEGIATIKLARPPVNALNFQMQAEIKEASEECDRRADVRAVVIYGGEKAFAAGADIKEMEGLTSGEMVTKGAAIEDAFSAVARIAKPVVAAVTGYALGGGCELALCADYRIAGNDVRMGQPEILLGIIPGGGGTQRLPRLVGPSVAKDLIFTGRIVAADEALSIGLVNRLVAPEDVYAEALAWASQFSKGPKVALAVAKEAIDRGLETSLPAGLEIETRYFSAVFDTEDQTIGMASFRAEGPGKAKFVGR
ncbi:MAG TPA: enoyl-CoA hydratase-related protein [Candidatus Nanopelagicaceae bacterium]|nr:enoyl-CoA hydratase-related protein [Candidatus Nanopelagicaceae bacterium]